MPLYCIRIPSLLLVSSASAQSALSSPPIALLVDTVEDQASTATWVADCSGGDCSLREAIEAANADPALDVIGFDVPAGGGVATIVLSTL